MPMPSPPSRTSDPFDPSNGFCLDGRWRVQPDINRIFDGDLEHQVPDKFMQVLVELAANGGVVSRQQLFDAVWPDTIVVDESLTRAISSLRKLFDDDPKHPRIIETIPKKGYRLLAPVESLVGCSEKATTDDDGLPQPAPVPPPSPTRRWPVILAAVIAIVSVAGWWAVLHHETRPDPESITMQVTALPGIEEYPALSPEGDRVAFVWDGDGHEPDGVFVQIIGAGPALRLTESDGHYAFPTWSHDSRFIAFSRLAGSPRGIFMVPATGGAEIELVAAEGEALLTAPTFSPDGRWIVFAKRRAPGNGWRLQRTDLESGMTDTLAPSAEIPFGGYRPRFSPDGSQLAFLRLDTDARTLAITTIDGTTTAFPDLVDRTVLDYDWTPDGNHLVINGAGEIAIVATDGAPARTVTEARSSGALSVARNKRLLTYSLGRREKNIWRWTPASGPKGESSRRIVHSTGWDAFPSLSPDGRRIAFLSDRTGSTRLWVADRNGSDEHIAAELEGVRWTPPTWSPDGRRIALTVDADGTPATRLVEVAGGRTQVLPSPDFGESHPSWSRDGQSLYVTRTTAAGGEIWRRPIGIDGPPLELIVTIGGAYQAVESPDGNAVFFTRARRTNEIWRCDRHGNDPRIAYSLDVGEILTWQPTEDGLYVGSRNEVGDPSYDIVFFEFASGATTDLLSVPGRLGFHLDIDLSNGGSIVFDQTEAVDSDIFAIENY